MDVKQTEIKCWCGKPLLTNGKTKWCSTSEIPKAHEKFGDVIGRTQPFYDKLYPDPETRLKR